MSKKVIIIIAIAITALVLFSACERSAAQPQTTPTAVGSTLTPQTTNIQLLQSWKTVTASIEQTQVALGTITAVPTSETPGETPTPTTVGSVNLPTPTSEVPSAGDTATSTPVPGVSTPVPVVPTATPGRPGNYVLHSGEFPYCLARRFDVNPDNLLSLNGLSNGQVLQPGLTLQIPQTGFFPGNRALHLHPAQYTVNVNDTIYGIACYFGDVDPTSIAAANNLSLSSPLVTGTILNIP
jgi:LysM repeat protein